MADGVDVYTELYGVGHMRSDGLEIHFNRAYEVTAGKLNGPPKTYICRIMDKGYLKEVQGNKVFPPKHVEGVELI